MKFIAAKIIVVLTLLMGVSAAEASWRGYSLGDVNLRSGPGVGYRVKAVVPRGASLSVNRCRGSWCNVDWRRWNGWMSSRLISDDGYYDQDVYDDTYYDEPYYGTGLIYVVPRVYGHKRYKKRYRKHYKKKKYKYKKRKHPRAKKRKVRSKKRKVRSKKRKLRRKNRKNVKRSSNKRRKSRSRRGKKVCKKRRCK